IDVRKHRAILPGFNGAIEQRTAGKRQVPAMRVVDKLLHLHRIDDELAFAAKLKQAIGNSAGIKGHGRWIPSVQEKYKRSTVITTNAKDYGASTSRRTKTR